MEEDEADAAKRESEALAGYVAALRGTSADPRAVEPAAAVLAAANPRAVAGAADASAADARAAPPAVADAVGNLLGELSEEDVARKDAEMDETKPDDVVFKAEGVSCSRRSLRTLLPETWLDDDIIHCYLRLLAERDARLCLADPTRKASHFFPSFFMTNCQSVGHARNPGKYCYKNVKNWSKKVRGESCFLVYWYSQ